MLRHTAAIVAGPLVDVIVDKYIEWLVLSTDGKELDEAQRKIFQPGTSVGLALAASPLLTALAADLAANFFVYCTADPREQGQRRIVKLAYDRAQPLATPRRAFERLGLRPVTDGYFVPAAGSAASYHVEITAPQDMRITDATFVGLQDGDVAHRRAIDIGAESVHVNLSNLDRGSGFVGVKMRPESAVITGAMTFALLNALALGFVLLRLPQFAGADSPDAVAAALLAAPGVALVYIARPTEHPIASAFLNGLRLLAFVAAITSFAGAIVLFAGYEAEQLKHVYAVLTGIAALSALALTSSRVASLISSKQLKPNPH